MCIAYSKLKSATIFLSVAFASAVIGVAEFAYAGIPEYCNDPSVKKISLPVFPDKQDSIRFNYSFRFIKASVPDAPTIIMLPGGPGATEITPKKWTRSQAAS